jgi:4-hydroxybenzoate polyprenyltransferase
MIALLVHAQLLMAASAAAVLYASARVLGIALSPWWFAAALLGTWTIYLLDAGRSRLDEDSLSQPERAALFCRHPYLYIVVPWITGAGAVIAAFLASPPPSTLWLLAALGAIGIAYAVPLLPSRTGGFHTLKDVALLKPLSICLAWTLGAVLLPTLIAASPPPWASVGALSCVFFLLLLADTLLLDLRDVEGDDAAGVSTFAVRFGTTATHAAVGGCLVLAGVATALGTPIAEHPDRWRRVGLIALASLALAWLFWPNVRRSEATTSAAMMAWRGCAALAAF